MIEAFDNFGILYLNIDIYSEARKNPALCRDNFALLAWPDYLPPQILNHIALTTATSEAWHNFYHFPTYYVWILISRQRHWSLRGRSHGLVVRYRSHLIYLHR